MPPHKRRPTRGERIQAAALVCYDGVGSRGGGAAGKWTVRDPPRLL